ncbi:metalloregulator ArsR/SmtB family transcription factor [Alteromonas sp. 5E99-2]|uniref:metalloregulator ArsR/SmtB family transcription factor n=1 Tax=Alteromonas sp. 5E99-2 TaxID=2817683 RepID=UPI001A9A06A1|nr:metalloregulator ArsR/SmtB family transcription factor [Alteromonas sp. 5E99-2]
MDPTLFYKCLADETRLKSLLLISLHESLCVCDLVTALELSQPKVSRHLAELRHCHLVVSKRKGKWMHYSLSPDLPIWVTEVLSLTASNEDFLQKETSRIRQINKCD